VAVVGHRLDSRVGAIVAAVPQPVLSRAARSLELRARDALDTLAGRRDPLVPPRRLDFVGHSDFRATGDEFLCHFVELGGLRPDERVLDIGCGIGRMARPLAVYLAPEGGYEGFDIVPEGIAWCQGRYPANFTFRRLDVHNARFHPAGREAAERASFPYEDAAFDFAFATSVFTHLRPEAADRYLAETARVLRAGGRALLTFFLAEQPVGDHVHRVGPALAVDPDVPEEAIAYPEAWVRERAAAHGLGVREPVHRGTWTGAREGRSFQDIVVLERS
jgi:SAM-dependent methyltransferase